MKVPVFSLLEGVVVWRGIKGTDFPNSLLRTEKFQEFQKQKPKDKAAQLLADSAFDARLPQL